jgi:hypothetical protein
MAKVIPFYIPDAFKSRVPGKQESGKLIPFRLKATKKSA